MYPCCILCGVEATILSAESVPARNQRWLCHFRIVYCDPSGRALVTGVGSSNLSINLFQLFAPKDPSLRWDSISEQVRIRVLPSPRAADSTHGYVLHDACWQLLQKACEPVGLSLDRLMSVCESRPFSLYLHRLHWGNDYGGLLVQDVDNAYEWMETFKAPVVPMPPALNDPYDGTDFHEWSTGSPRPERFYGLAAPCLNASEIRLLCSNNTISGLDRDFALTKGLFPLLLADSPSSESNTPTLRDAIPPHLKNATDCFSILPRELRMLICLSLPTKDALNLRLASRSFQHIFFSSVFWLSRFEPDGERGFLYEQRETRRARSITELLHLHRFSSSSFSPPRLLNRRRVWNLARNLASIIKLSHANPISYRQLGSCDGEGWIRLAAHESPSDSCIEFYYWFRPTRTIHVDIAPGATRIGIMTANMGTLDYVTGIKVVDRNGAEQVLGYKFNDDEMLCEVAALHGFRVAMGMAGVRALQVIDKGGQASGWKGYTEGVPRSDRLVTAAPVTSLAVTLDGYKVTALAVRASRPDLSDTTRPPETSLRRTAFWYPDIPPGELLLNERSFADQGPMCVTYEPLSWIHFGGSRGSNLRHIRGLQILFSRNLYCLQFLYTWDYGIRTSKKLGRRALVKESPDHFPIDGAGGERVVSFRIGQNFSFCIDSFMIVTNRGRTKYFGTGSHVPDTQLIDCTDGTTITGLYGQFADYRGIYRLGVISEQITDSQ